MLLIDDYKVAYLHINKTGGTSIKQHLVDITHPAHAIQMGPTHGPLASKVRLLGERFYDYTILTSIRNPYARLLSIYLFRRRRFKDGEEAPAMKAAHGLPFKRWFVETIKHSTRLTDLSISDSILIEGMLPDNVYLVAVESLTKDIDRFVKDVMEIGTDKQVPHVNRTDLIKGHHKKYYDSEMAQLVHEWDKWVIDNYYPWSVDNYF